MGLDINRFPEPVDDEFKCSICCGVLEDPVRGNCGHVFCRTCILTWLERPGSYRINGSCPVDRSVMNRNDLISAAVNFKTILSRLKISCDYKEYGCNSLIPLADIKSHVEKCNFNPEEIVQCPNGCEKLYQRKSLVKRPHNCIKELQKIIRDQECEISLLELRESQHQSLAKYASIVFASLLILLLAMAVSLYGSQIPLLPNNSL